MIRSFVAVDLPDRITDALHEVAEALRPQVPERSVRWTSVAGIHLTLKFLGNVREEDLVGIKDALAEVGQRNTPFTFTVTGVGCFPNVKRPRVIWIGVEETTGNLAALQRDVEKSLEPLGFEREKRPFHPHLTLGRARRGIYSGDQQRLGDAIANATVGELGKVHATSFRLMRSDLRPDGAIYTSLATFSLQSVDD